LESLHAEIRRLVAWRDGRGRRAFAIPVATGSDDAEITALDRISIGEWMDARGLRSPRLRWMVDYACRDDYGSRAAHTSAWAGLFYFAARMGHPGGQTRPLLTWPEGNGRLIAHLHGRVRENVRLGTTAAALEPHAAGVRVVTIDRDGRV